MARIALTMIVLASVTYTLANIVCVEDENMNVLYCYKCYSRISPSNRCVTYTPRFCRSVLSLPCARNITRGRGITCVVDSCRILSSINYGRESKQVRFYKSYEEKKQTIEQQGVVQITTTTTTITTTTEVTGSPLVTERTSDTENSSEMDMATESLQTTVRTVEQTTILEDGTNDTMVTNGTSTHRPTIAAKVNCTAKPVFFKEKEEETGEKLNQVASREKVHLSSKKKRSQIPILSSHVYDHLYPYERRQLSWPPPRKKGSLTLNKFNTRRNISERVWYFQPKLPKYNKAKWFNQPIIPKVDYLYKEYEKNSLESSKEIDIAILTTKQPVTHKNTYVPHSTESFEVTTQQNIRDSMAPTKRQMFLRHKSKQNLQLQIDINELRHLLFMTQNNVKVEALTCPNGMVCSYELKFRHPCQKLLLSPPDCICKGQRFCKHEKVSGGMCPQWSCVNGTMSTTTSTTSSSTSNPTSSPTSSTSTTTSKPPMTDGFKTATIVLLVLLLLAFGAFCIFIIYKLIKRTIPYTRVRNSVEQEETEMTHFNSPIIRPRPPTFSFDTSSAESSYGTFRQNETVAAILGSNNLPILSDTTGDEDNNLAPLGHKSSGTPSPMSTSEEEIVTKRVEKKREAHKGAMRYRNYLPSTDDEDKKKKKKKRKRRCKTTK